jgi:hypothetical protein
MSFVIGAQAKQIEVFVTEDGKEFKTVEAAQKHQDRINAGEFAAVVVSPDVEAFVNSEGLSGRARAIRINAISAYKAFMTAWDGEAVAFNEEAAAKLAAAKAKPAANAEGEGAGTGEGEQEAPLVEENLL